jgi:hypothetical protein
VRKRKRKLTSAEKVEKKRRQKEYMTIFINGKQKRVKRPPAIDGMDVDEFICRNADPIWLHQNEMWEYMTIDEEPYKSPQPSVPDRSARRFSDDGDRGALPDEDGER